MLDTAVGLLCVFAPIALLLGYVGRRIVKVREAHYREHRLRKAAEYAKAYAQAIWDTRTSGRYVDEMTGETFEESIARRKFQSEEEEQIYRDTFYEEMVVRVNAMADADAKESSYVTAYGGRRRARPNFRHEDLREAYNSAYLAGQAQRQVMLGAATAVTANLTRELRRADFNTGGFTGRPSNPDLFAVLSPGREERTVVDAVRALQPSSDPVQRARDRSRARSEFARQRTPEPETLEAVYRWPESMPPDDESEQIIAEVLIRPAGLRDDDKNPWTMCGHIATNGYTSPNLDQQALRFLYDGVKAAKAGELVSPTKSDQPPARRLRRRPDDV